MTRSIRTTPPTAPRRPSSCSSGQARGARRSVRAFAAIATDVSALYYNPAGIALMPRAGALVGTYDYVAETRYSWGGIAFPFGGGSRAVGISGRNLRLQGPAGVYRGTAGRHRLGVLGESDGRRPHLRAELLRPVLGRYHRQGSVRQPGRGVGCRPSRSTSAPTSTPSSAATRSGSPSWCPTWAPTCRTAAARSRPTPRGTPSPARRRFRRTRSRPSSGPRTSRCPPSSGWVWPTI